MVQPKLKTDVWLITTNRIVFPEHTDRVALRDKRRWRNDNSMPLNPDQTYCGRSDCTWLSHIGLINYERARS